MAWLNCRIWILLEFGFPSHLLLEFHVYIVSFESKARKVSLHRAFVIYASVPSDCLKFFYITHTLGVYHLIVSDIEIKINLKRRVNFSRLEGVAYLIHCYSRCDPSWGMNIYLLPRMLSQVGTASFRPRIWNWHSITTGTSLKQELSATLPGFMPTVYKEAY